MKPHHFDAASVRLTHVSIQSLSVLSAIPCRDDPPISLYWCLPSPSVPIPAGDRIRRRAQQPNCPLSVTPQFKVTSARLLSDTSNTASIAFRRALANAISTNVGSPVVITGSSRASRSLTETDHDSCSRPSTRSMSSSEFSFKLSKVARPCFVSVCRDPHYQIGKVKFFRGDRRRSLTQAFDGLQQGPKSAPVKILFCCFRNELFRLMQLLPANQSGVAIHEGTTQMSLLSLEHASLLEDVCLGMSH